MLQTSIFTAVCWVDSARADVESAGGAKVVGSALWPDLDPETAGRKLSNALNPRQKQALTYEQLQVVKQLARTECGRSQLHEFESADLNFEGKWLTSEDLKARRRKRKASLLAELMELEQEEE
jgi:hypothetical protein